LSGTACSSKKFPAAISRGAGPKELIADVVSAWYNGENSSEEADLSTAKMEVPSMSNWNFAEPARLFAVAIALASASPTAYAETARVHITLFGARPADGAGVMFFHTRRWRLHVSGVDIKAPVPERAELDGSASNMHVAGDIVASFHPAAPGAAIVSGSRAARLENAKGVVLELRGMNLGASDLDLAGMVIGSRGWRANRAWNPARH
jgi:hypothetical protein